MISNPLASELQETGFMGGHFSYQLASSGGTALTVPLAVCAAFRRKPKRLEIIKFILFIPLKGEALDLFFW